MSVIDKTNPFYAAARELKLTDSEFSKRIEELLARANRLLTRERDGWHYKRSYIAPHKVKAHTRNGYYKMVPRKKT